MSTMTIGILCFIGGLFVGATLGIFCIGLLSANKTNAIKPQVFKSGTLYKIPIPNPSLIISAHFVHFYVIII